MRTIKARQLVSEIGKGTRYQLIDVRSAGEFAACHIPGAVNIPLEQLEVRLADVNPADQVVLVCQSGMRACSSHEFLRSHRDDLTVLSGGTDEWLAEGLPSVMGSGPKWSIERQVRLAAGFLVLVGVSLSFLVHPAWAVLAGLVGAGLTFAGLTNICGMAALFLLMPWNRPPQVKIDRPARKLGRKTP